MKENKNLSKFQRRNRSYLLAFMVLALSTGILGFSFSVQKETRTLAAGEEYRASGIHMLFLGKDYRDLWATPITVDVLDLNTFGGGLRPVMRVGGIQTLGLAMKGEDGQSYTFRGIDKDPTSFLPPSFQHTLAARLIQDQTAAAHPGGALVVPSLSKAIGLFHTDIKLCVMPDDPRLGDFREDFAGTLGTISVYPTPKSENHPGTFGAVEILSSEEMWTRLLSGSQQRVDTRMFLRSRLLDFLIGDWDRHRGQWRWARIPGLRGWQPIAEDRDQAFASYEGLVLSWVRFRNPQLVEYGPKYPSIEGLAWNGREVDRKILTDLEWSTWKEIVGDIKRLLTDDVIEAALRQMPEEYFDLSGEDLIFFLKKRREILHEVAWKFYNHLASEVEVYGTNKADFVEVQSSDNRTVKVKITLAEDGNKQNQPYYERSFDPKVTNEIRIFLLEGADRVVTSGGPIKSIKVRIIGGGGHNSVDDSKGGGIRLYDDKAGEQFIPGPGSKLDTRSYQRPLVDPRNELLYARDYGRRTMPLFWFGFSSDIGLFLGGGGHSEGYGFRKDPYADSHLLRAGYATAAKTGRLEYSGKYRIENSSLFSSVDGLASGIEILRFYGFGNETRADKPDEFYKIRQAEFSIFSALHYDLSKKSKIFAGVHLKYSILRENPDTLLGQLRPYGAENYGQLGIRLGFSLDTRNSTRPTSSGIQIHTEGFVFPEIADVEDTFGGLKGDISGTIRFVERLSFAVRIGGKIVFGNYPYHEAAFIGGSMSVRGFRKNRFAGDASLYGNLELRLVLGKTIIILPGEYGIFGLIDAGRVFFEGESSKLWHPAYGGGLFFSVLDLATVFSFAVAVSEERTAVYFRAGLSF